MGHGEGILVTNDTHHVQNHRAETTHHTCIYNI